MKPTDGGAVRWLCVLAIEICMDGPGWMDLWTDPDGLRRLAVTHLIIEFIYGIWKFYIVFRVPLDGPGETREAVRSAGDRARTLPKTFTL